MDAARLPQLAVAAAIVAGAAGVARAQPAPAPGPLYDGGAALEAGRLDEAATLLARAAVELKTDRAWAWFDLCLTHYAAGAFGAAINACYHALEDPLTEDRVVPLLGEIRAQITGARLSLAGLQLPDPRAAWFRPDPDLDRVLAIAHVPPADQVHVTRDLAPPLVPDAVTFEALGPDAVARLRGPAPPLPYRAPPRSHDYSVGYDVDLKAGLLFYAPDTTPFVVGARADLRRRMFGAAIHGHTFVEYLQAVDGHGGVGAVGVGTAGESTFGVESSFSIPWGRDDRRNNVAFPGYTTSLHGDLRLTYRHEIPISWGDRISIEASITGSVNLPKLAIRIGDALGDLCWDNNEEEHCPTTPDANPWWRMGYWMVNLSVGFGRRSGYPRYDHAELWAPAGGPPP